MIITVNSSAALTSAINSAHDGDTIQLAAGEYSISKIQNLNFANGVTITSADPTHKAVIDGLNLQNDNGLTFSNLQVNVDEKTTYGVFVNGGNHLNFNNLEVHGTAVGDGVGIEVIGATGVNIANANIHDVHGGIVIGRSDTVSVTNSSIHNIQLDGIQVAGTSDVTISGNNFTQFFPKAGDHSDAIQFVTAGTTASAKNITITNNTYVRGDAPAAVQGIFLGNEASLPYQNVTISGNTILGGIYQGIDVTDAQNLSLTHNTVEGYSDINSWILTQGITNGVESGNIATSFVNGTQANVGLVVSGDTTIGLGSVGDVSLLTAAEKAAIAAISSTAVAAAANTAAAAATPAVTSALAAIATPTAAVVAPVATGPLELVGVKLTTTTAAISAPVGAAGVILDANTHVWSTTEIGSSGNDTLNAGLGADSMTGGGGGDHFVFSGMPGGPADITDFNPSQDVIDLRGMLTTAGYHGTNAIADHYISLVSDGAGGTKVMFDADGTGPAAAKYIIHVEHVAPTALTAGDWLFH